MWESFLFLNPRQTSKDPWLEKTLKNTLNRYLESEPLGPQHTSLTLILIRCLVLEQAGIKYCALLPYYIGFSVSRVNMLCFLSLHHTLTPKTGGQLLLSETDIKYRCLTMFPSYPISQPWIALAKTLQLLWTDLNPADWISVLVPRKSCLSNIRQVIPGLSPSALKN